MKFENRRTSLAYVPLRILPGIAVTAACVLAGVRAWKPAAQVSQGMPLLLPALFLCYALPLLLSFFLFSGRFRLAFWLPALALAFLGAALGARLLPASGEGAEFARFSKEFISAVCLATALGSLCLGALLARSRWAVAVELALMAVLGVLVLIALHGDPDRLAAPKIAFLLIWYTAHSLAVEHAFAILPEERTAMRRFSLSYAARYALLMLTIGLLYYCVAFLGYCGDTLRPANQPVSPYENKGLPGQGGKDQERLQRPREAGQYIHSLKPIVKLDGKYNPGEKTLLYNVFVKSFEGRPVERFYGTDEWADFRTLYLGRFVLSKYDPELDSFTLDLEEPVRASFFGQPLPFDKIKLSPNAVIPLGGAGAASGLRRRLSLVISLTPFIDGDEAISPDYPVALSVLMRKTDAEARRMLDENIRRYGDSQLDVERVYVAAYALEADAVANDLAGLDDQKASLAAINAPDIKLSVADREYYTTTGGDADAQRVRELALALTADSVGPVEKAATIRDFFTLQGSERPAKWGKPFTYDLEPGKAASGASPLQAFLFDHRRGYCQYYALASTVMLRSLGIPARVIAGYLGVDRSTRNQGYYYIYSNQAHAWTEIFLNGIGWVQLDATPSAPPSLEGILGPPGPDGTPLEFPNPPEWSVVAVFGKVVSTAGSSIAIAPEAYQIGCPVSFAGLSEEERARIPDIYEQSHSTGPLVPFAPAGMVVELDRDLVIYTQDRSATGKAVLNLEFGVSPRQAAADLGERARRDAEAGRETRVTVVGKFSTAAAMSGRSGMDAIKTEYELLGLYGPGFATEEERQASARRNSTLTVLAILGIFASIAFILPLGLYFLMRSAAVRAPGRRRRTLFLLEYMRYRLFTVGVRRYGLSLEEWKDWLLRVHGMDLSEPVALIQRMRYDPSYAEGLSARQAARLRAAFEDSFHAAFPMERSLVSLFDPLKAIEYLRDRGASVIKAAAGRRSE